MLSRIANNLFWMGRYLERAEYHARYCKVQYMTCLDAPTFFSKDAALASMLKLTDSHEVYFSKHDEISDHQVFKLITLDGSHPDSIKNIIRYARENCRSVQNLLVQEIWQATNQLYHSIEVFSTRSPKQERKYDFFQHVIDSVYIIKGVIANTLLKDETSAMIFMGFYMERSVQINRIALAKIFDIEHIPEDKLGTPVENFQWANLMKSAGGFDISRRIYRSVITRRKALEFLLLNGSFPKSIVFSVGEIVKCLDTLSFTEDLKPGTVAFETGKLEASLRFTTIDDLGPDQKKYLEELLEKLNNIAGGFEKTYLA